MTSSENKNSTDADLRINIIVATDAKRGIGINGILPWKLPTETKYFHEMINHVSSPEKQNAVVLGRITYESIQQLVDYEKLLKIVVTKFLRPTPADKNLRFVESFKEAVCFLKKEKFHRKIETVWSLGGSGVYQQSLESPFLHRIYYTHVLAEFPCDTHFPEMDFSKFQIVEDDRVSSEIQSDGNLQYQVKIYERRR